MIEHHEIHGKQIACKVIPGILHTGRDPFALCTVLILPEGTLTPGSAESADIVKKLFARYDNSERLIVVSAHDDNFELIGSLTSAYSMVGGVQQMVRLYLSQHFIPAEPKPPFAYLTNL